MNLRSPNIYKNGEPVYYFGIGGRQRLYMSGKIGSYRVLSSNPAIDSGICVEIEKLSTSVFAAPNDNGIFSSASCNHISYRLDHNYKVRVSFVQSGPDDWCMAVTELCFGNSGFHSPISSRFPQRSLEAAAWDELVPLLKRLGEMAAGTGRDIATSVPKSGIPKARRFARNAILEIVTALPRPLASDILKSLTAQNLQS